MVVELRTPTRRTSLRVSVTGAVQKPDREGGCDRTPVQKPDREGGCDGPQKLKGFPTEIGKPFFVGRDDWIRTSDLTHPKRARYQAAPRPVKAISVWRENILCQTRESIDPEVARASRPRTHAQDARATMIDAEPIISSWNASLRVPRLPHQADRESHEVDGRFASTNRVVHP